MQIHPQFLYIFLNSVRLKYFRNYGIGPYYHAVAVVRKINPGILISNWKFTRVCQSGVGRATGWIIPLNFILETAQVRVYGRHLIYALSKFDNLPASKNGIDKFGFIAYLI